MFVNFADAPALAAVFSNVVSIAQFAPDPHTLDGPRSAAEIDQVIRQLALDFQPVETADMLIDQGRAEGSPPGDINGQRRPLGPQVDLGPFEVRAP